MSAFMANEKTCVGAQVFSGLRITLTGNSQPTVYHRLWVFLNNL